MALLVSVSYTPFRSLVTNCHFVTFDPFSKSLTATSAGTVYTTAAAG